ncbi:MAG: hypothetical protein M8364_08320 [Methylobacter sp.]|uniref:hypothetical protein n=1 Tax=Methylobacter sp. TaxID=2051955 RepID=UPI0025842B95|nr:hypothetical protein [Methylobacter sp.]MCL7420892.1 hypothetical protein [Methylobacter sp.]
MPTIHSELRAELDQILKQLLSEQQALSDRLLAQNHYPLWAQHFDAPADREQLAAFIKLVVYANDEMKPGETLNYIGMCGTDLATMEQIERVNQLRHGLQRLLMRMDKILVKLDETQMPLSKYALERMGYARFSRRQASRKFFYFPHALESISFTWFRSRMVSRLSVADAQHLLEKKISGGGEAAYIAGMKMQLKLLATIPFDEPLAQVSPPSNHPRANIAWFDENRILRRKVCMAVGPIFFLAAEHTALPRFRALSENPENKPLRLKRIDVEIQDEVFLPSIKVHRYLPELREKKKNEQGH